MGRGGISVSRVTADQEQRLAPLWVAARTAAGQSADWADRAVREGRVRSALEREDVRVYLAERDGQPVGFAAVTASPLSGLGEESAVWIDQIYVTPGSRRRGVAKELLAAVATYADLRGVGQVTSCVPAGEKHTNRYFARLGFAAQVTVRSTPTRALHRRLGDDEQTSTTEEIVRRRRSLRERARHGLRHPEIEPETGA